MTAPRDKAREIAEEHTESGSLQCRELIDAITAALIEYGQACREEMKGEMELAIKMGQLAVANSDTLRPDIKHGHWIACHDISKALRALKGKP